MLAVFAILQLGDSKAEWNRFDGGKLA